MKTSRSLWITFLGVVLCSPFWAQDQNTSAPGAPDNTKTNVRDRSKSEPTADHQKDNASDKALTQQIRKAIQADKSLSVYAHNVKVITQNGNVVLKGPVRSVGEKQSVESKAVEIAGTDRVSSQLEVVPDK